MEEANEASDTTIIYQDRAPYGSGYHVKAVQQGNVSYRDEACNTIIMHDTKENLKFLKSMTFTSVTAKCDCDECCDVDGIKKGNSPLPQAIDAAIQSYKRTKRAEVLVKRSQVRTLIGRSTVLKDLAVWDLTMPSLAEPLIEFGNPLVYRIIWISRLHKSLLVKRIGCGIIGSNAEEQGREELDWIENDVVVVSSKDQKAIGYVVEPAQLDDAIIDTEAKSNSATLPGPAVFYIAKIPSNLFINDNNNHVEDEALLSDAGNNFSSSFEIIRRICSIAVQSLNNDKISANSIRLGQQDQILFRKSIAAILKR